MKEIITDPNFLKQRCEWIQKKDYQNPETKQIIEDLLYTAKRNYNCAGLAANQIGYLKCAIVVKINNSFVPMINPQIKRHGKLVTKEESCLSFPGKITKRKRSNKVKVSYFDPINNIQIPCLKLKGFEARIVQHELDHLCGKCI
jgi:peptide deformylase